MTKSRARAAAARVVLAGLCASLAVGSGCASSGEPEPQMPAMSVEEEMASAPDWTRGGCGATPARDGRARLCAVGSATRVHDVGRGRTTAIVRARAEIARSLETKLRAILEDHRAATAKTGDSGSAGAQGLPAADIPRQITDMSLAGTRIERLWISPRNSVFVLVVLDVARFERSLAKMTQLPEPVREAVGKGTRAAFE